MLSQTVLRALRFAFPLTVPIAAGFLFIGPYVRVIYRFTGATFRVPPYYVFAYFCRVYGIYYSDAVISTL